jgi:hypothetical protein
MKPTYILVFALLCILFTSGCDPTRITMYYNQTAYPPTDSVLVFLDTLPSQPYFEMGVISHSHYFEDIVKAAKANGADGLINIERYGDPRVRQNSRDGDWDIIWVDTLMEAVMIKFKPAQ